MVSLWKSLDKQHLLMDWILSQTYKFSLKETIAQWSQTAFPSEYKFLNWIIV